MEAEEHHREEQVIRVSKVPQFLRRSFRRVGSMVTSSTFWLAILVVGNLVFFAANVSRPVKDFVNEILTFGGSSNELIATIKSIEESSGVLMEDFVEVAFNNIKSLKMDVANTEARTRRIEAALVQPLIRTWRYNISNDGADCLGGMEAIFWKNEAKSVVSYDGVRQASFSDSLGYIHAFSAMCFKDNLAVFATGYNAAGTEEKFADIIADVSEKWPEPEATEE